MEQKKKSNNFIIPATFFTSLSPKKVAQQQKTTTANKQQTPKVVVNTPTEVSAVPKLKDIKRRRSALSLKSVHEKKEALTISDKEENFDNHPKTSFSNEQLNEAIKKYYFELTSKGENSLASVINSANISLHEHFEIKLEIVSELIKKQIDTGKPKLLKFLREQLNNYGITITTIVNKTIEKKFVYTNQEKYEKMKEKNPMLAQLKNTFGLDV